MNYKKNRAVIVRQSKTRKKIGQQFGNLKIIDVDEYNGKQIKYICKCNLCGSIKSYFYSILKKEVDKSGKPKDCGCTRKNTTPATIDMIGKRYGKLVVLKEAGRDNQRQRLYLCQCDCGSQAILRGYKIRQGDALSCGHCMQTKFERIKNEQIRKRYIRLHSSPTYKLCRDWEEHPEHFEEWYLAHCTGEMGEYLTKIDKSKEYSPENCQFVSRYNLEPSGRQYIVQVYGESYNLKKLSEKYNLSYPLVLKRFKKGVRGEDLIKNNRLGIPIGKFDSDGKLVKEYPSLIKASKAIGMSTYRLKNYIPPTGTSDLGLNDEYTYGYIKNKETEYYKELSPEETEKKVAKAREYRRLREKRASARGKEMSPSAQKTISTPIHSRRGKANLLAGCDCELQPDKEKNKKEKE